MDNEIKMDNEINWIPEELLSLSDYEQDIRIDKILEIDSHFDYDKEDYPEIHKSLYVQCILLIQNKYDPLETRDDFVKKYLKKMDRLYKDELSICYKLYTLHI